LEVEEEVGPPPPPQPGAQRLDVARSFLQNQQSQKGREHPNLPGTYATSSIIINGVREKQHYYLVSPNTMPHCLVGMID
jgi:hypothetical protein